MGNGCTRAGFHWAAGGVGNARPRVMRGRFRRRKSCGNFAISVTRRVVRGCRQNEYGILYGLQLERCPMTGGFKFATCANVDIVQ